MIQIPDNVRPVIDAVVKHHFWLLVALVPFLVLPVVFGARGRLASEIDASRGQVESRLAAVKSVSGIQPHPNDAWTNEIDKATRRVKLDTLSEWQRLWTSQQPLRAWPASLGQDFVQRVAALKPGGKLPRPLLERYQNGVRAVVRSLPSRMGADELMMESEAAAAPPMMEPGMPRVRPGVQEKPAAPVRWEPTDQQRLYASFNWAKPPSTLQVLLAQEELWVYGLLADAIARANKAAAGPFNAAIPVVESILVGYPAAEDDPGASRGGRIALPSAPGAAPAGEFSPPPEMMGSPEGGGSVRPLHPRFAGGGEGPMAAGPMDAPPPEATTSPDDLLRNWIYVDFNGKPLTSAEISASPDAQLVHLVPFMVRAVIDERKIDALLTDLSTMPVPIDVRQVRINTASSAGMAGGRAPVAEFGSGPVEFGGRAPAGSRPNDVTIEVRGTVGLATVPDPQVLGLDAAAGDELPAADDAAVAPPPAPGKPAAEPVGAAQP